MGQTVVINASTVVDEHLMLDTDRSFTGQDGHTIGPGEDGGAVPGQLAAKVYALDLGVDHVHVLQNIVTLRRPGGWDDAAVEQVKDAVIGFLRFYPGV